MSVPEYTYIYRLSDPRDGSIRYVGKSNDPEYRLRSHINHRLKKGLTPVKSWICELVNLGLKPTISIVMKVPRDRWVRFEKALISSYTKAGHDLLNLVGGGGRMEWTNEQKERAREAALKRWADPEYRARQKEARRRLSSNPSYIERCKKNTEGLWQDPGYRNKIVKGVTESWTEERREIASEVQSGLWDDERRALLSERNNEYWADEQNRISLSKWNEETWKDEEIAKKRKVGISAAWTPERRKAASERISNLNKDPEFQKRALEERRKKHGW